MNSISIFPRVMITFICLGFFASCNYGLDTLPQRYSKVTLYGIAQSAAASPGQEINIGAFRVSNFQVGTQDMDMSFASSTEFGIGSDINNVTIRSNQDAELAVASSKPQTNILITSGNLRTSVIGEGSTPNGNYTEITFKLYANTTAPSGSFVRNKSLYIIGNYSGKPVRMWLVSEETVRATTATPNGVQIASDSDLILKFNLDKLLENIDFASAKDANSDGIIDIGPNNVDGNGELFSSLRSNLSHSVELSL